MITEEQLAEWEPMPLSLISDYQGTRIVPALIAEVRRLRAELEATYGDQLTALSKVTRERDALREVVEQIAEGEGCYTHGYATNCDMECQAKARAALAKMDEVKP